MINALIVGGDPKSMIAISRSAATDKEEPLSPGAS